MCDLRDPYPFAVVEFARDRGDLVWLVAGSPSWSGVCGAVRISLTRACVCVRFEESRVAECEAFRRMVSALSGTAWNAPHSVPHNAPHNAPPIVLHFASHPCPR